MKFLANENVPLLSVKILEENGYDIISVGRDFAGYLDHEVMELAMKENRTIITFDRDYWELIFKKGYKPYAGVIYITWHNYKSTESGEYLIELFEHRNIDYKRTLTVISENSIRQRKY